MYVSKADAAKAREMDLLTYMENYEPDNLFRVCAGNYRLVEHDSVVISNGLWCQKSTGIGGRTALDYLVKVRRIPFPDAVAQIIGKSSVQRPIFRKQPVKRKEISFSLPTESNNFVRARSYLNARGIPDSVIDFFFQAGLIYESRQHHNVVFVGRDYLTGKPKYAMMRGCGTSFKGEVAGSDKRYGFRWESGSSVVHIFEAAIDLLSYASIRCLTGVDWESESLLSLGGIAAYSTSALPIALEEYLKHNPQTKAAVLHLDNDEKGRIATQKIQENLLSQNIGVDHHFVSHGKDVNDELRWMLQAGILDTSK